MADKISDEDKALFREQMRSVKPLKEKKISTHQDPTPPRKIKRNGSSLPTPQKQELFLSDYITEQVQSNTTLSYVLPSLPTKRFKELKNGLIPREARLDLHGLHTDEAREALSNFILRQVEEQKRCVLIVHGIGGQEGAPPIIKNLVNRWLPQFNQILAFHSALPKDGGYGAVYVLLKRMKI